MTAKAWNYRAIGAHTLLLIVVATTFIPLLWMKGMSFRLPRDMFVNPLNPIPPSLTLSNYRDVFDAANVPRQLLNSIIFAGGITIGQIAISVPAAYAFSRGGFRGAHRLFDLMLLTIPIPFVVLYVPNFLFLSRFDLLNSYTGLILPQLASAYGVFLLRQHFRSFPHELIDAARTDGAGEVRTLLQIVVPTARAAIAAVAVFVFISSWNEYIWPLLVAPRLDMQILTVGTVNFANQEGGLRWGPIMAAAMISTLPALLAYIAVRKQILAIMLEGAIKG